MRRSLIIVLAALLAALTLACGSFLIAKRLCATHLTRNADDLEWLRREFRLSDADLQRVRRLHEGYLPQCGQVCERIAAKKRELQTALTAGNGVTPEVEKKLAEVAALRTQCQTQMLRHFHEVSQAMPPEQGRRYLAEMERLTLGFHDQFEQTMSQGHAPSHGH